MSFLAQMRRTETPWWQGTAIKLLNKTTLVEANGPDQLPVYTLTFGMPSDDDTQFAGRAMHHKKVAIDLGDVVKMVIPGYKPKSYSMSAIRANEFDLTFKVYPNGRASGYLDRLKIGDETNSFGMSARRFRNPGAYVGIVSYGVGITEGLPLARAELEKGDADKVVLLWASRTMKDTFWHDDINDLEKKYPTKFEMVNILSRERREGCLHGRVDPSILSQVFQPTKREDARFLSVGTKEMMNLTDTMLSQVGYKMPQHALLPKL